MRVLLPPVDNLSGGRAPGKELLAPIATGLARRGLDVVEGEPVEDFLSRHRLRHVGGIDGAGAAAAHEELGGRRDRRHHGPVLQPRTPPRARHHDAARLGEREPRILWIDGTFAPATTPRACSGSADHQHGEAAERRRSPTSRARWRGLPGAGSRRSRAATLSSASGRSSPTARPGSIRRRPTRSRSSRSVEPHTTRRGAGEVVALEFVRQLATVPGLRVLEPGVVRELAASATGSSRRAGSRVDRPDAPRLDRQRPHPRRLGPRLTRNRECRPWSFDASLIETRTGEVIWESASKAKGDDGVHYAKSAR